MTSRLDPSKMTIILVMGVTGVGKSTFIQYATGEKVVIGDGLEACKSLISMDSCSRLSYTRKVQANPKASAFLGPMFSLLILQGSMIPTTATPQS